MNEPLVEAKSLVKNYRLEGRTVEVLKGVDLSVVRGKATAIVGNSGAGKSTLLHLIGLLERPTAGTLVFDNRPMNRLTDRELSLIHI